MPRNHFIYVTALLIAILTSVSAVAAPPAGPPSKTSAAATEILKRTASIDQDLSRDLGKLALTGKLPDKTDHPGVHPYEGYRAVLHQLRIRAMRLQGPEQMQVRKAIRNAMKKTELLQKEEKNQKLFTADKQRTMRRRGLALPKPEKAPVPASAVPAVAPPNDNCANATPVNEGSFSGTTVGATNDGSESCVGDPSEDIWYAYTATVTSTIRVDTEGSNFDTVLSVHSLPCPGTSEIACNDDCMGVDSCVTFPATAGSTYLIRVGGYSQGETGNVQLHIGQVGAISGTVTGTDTLSPVPDAYLDIFDSEGNSAGYAYTDSAGQYTTSALPGGTYFIVAYGNNEYLDELYDNLPCYHGNCDPLTGTPVTVTAGATTSNIDFALDPGGAIAGSLTETNTAPIAYQDVEIYDENGRYAGQGYTDESGSYRVGGLLTGTYFAKTDAYGDYLNVLYDNIPCPSYCDPTTGTPIAVTQGQTTPNIDFTLPHLGHIAGHITNEATGQPIPGVEVDIYDQNGNWQSYGYTDAAGNYTAAGLQTGNFVVRTYGDSSGFVGELYNNISCPHGRCNLLLGTPVPVVSGHVTSGIDFALVKGGTISGRVLTVDGQPISYANIRVFDLNSDEVSDTYADQGGYYSAKGLAAGTFFVYVDAYGYFAQVYAGLPCPNLSCSPVAGTPVPVAASQLVTGINFALVRGGSILGTVTDSTIHRPIPYAEVDIYDPSGNWMAYGYTDENGQYEVSGLLTGNYFATTNTYGDYIDELYKNIPCPRGYCDVTTGTSIPVVESQDTTNISFALDTGGSISGTLLDATTAQPIPEAEIDVFDSDGQYASYGYTDAAGTYRAEGLPTGNYFATTETYGSHLNELYDNIPCPRYGCNPETGTPIAVVVKRNTPGIDFVLDPGGSISGWIIDSGTQLPLTDSYGYVSIYDSDGEYAGYGYTDTTGHYSITGLAGGSYFAVAGAHGYLDSLYQNHECPWSLCSVTSGDPIPVTLNADTSIDIALSRAASVSGTVTDGATHQPLQYVFVSAQDSSGNGAYTLSDSNGNYSVTGLVAGTYYVTASYDGYIVQLYQGISCPYYLCDIATGTPVVVTDAADTSGIDFGLQSQPSQPPPGTIQGTVTRSSNGSPIEEASITIYDAQDNQVAYGYTDAAGTYTVEVPAPGAYFVAVSRDGYASKLYNGIPCPPLSCNPTAGTPIAVEAGTRTGGIDVALDLSSVIRGVVWDQESHTPLSNVQIKVLTAGGTVANIGYTDGMGQYRIRELAAGTYYLVTAETEGYEDQLYNGVPCPEGHCALVSGTPVSVAAGETANGINFALKIRTCLYCDDFDDAALPDFTYLKPAWSESSGSLVGSPTRKKALLLASPAFAGCSVCIIDTSVKISTGSLGKLWLIGWDSGKNMLELLIKSDVNRWILKERVNGIVVQKTKAVKPITADAAYQVRMAFDGSTVRVFVDDMATPLITMKPTSPLNGTVGFAVKDTTASFDYLYVN